MKLAGRMVTDDFWRKNTGKTAILEADKTAYIEAVPGKGNKQLKAVDNYGMKPAEQIMQNANLPKVDRLNKEEFENWWELQQTKEISTLKMSISFRFALTKASKSISLIKAILI